MGLVSTLGFPTFISMSCTGRMPSSEILTTLCPCINMSIMLDAEAMHRALFPYPMQTHIHAFHPNASFHTSYRTIDDPITITVISKRQIVPCPCHTDHAFALGKTISAPAGATAEEGFSFVNIPYTLFCPFAARVIFENCASGSLFPTLRLSRTLQHNSSAKWE